jgi:hypothetical protein
MEVENQIWNTFHVGNFFQISTDFKLTQRFLANWEELWLDRLVEILISNAPELHFEQGFLHGDFQRFCYDLDDWYTLISKIKEDIEF